MGNINSEENTPKCPMGKYPWLAVFVLLAFVALVIAKKLGFM